MSIFKIIVNKLFYESFYIAFIGNRKKCQDINCFFFPIKTFIQWLTNKCPYGIC